MSAGRATRVIASAVFVVALAGRVLAAPLPITPGPSFRVLPYSIYGAGRNETVTVFVPTTISVPVTIPAAARLLSAVAVPDMVGSGNVTATAQAMRFRVLLDAGGATTTLYERVVDIARVPADRRWFEFGRDLSAWAGQQATLRFETSLVDASSKPHTLALWAPPDLATCDGGRPSVVLIVVDALRADHVTAMGYARPTTPYLDAFAADARRFRAAFAAAPRTIPSVPQMLTGATYPNSGESGLSGWLGPGRFATSRAIVDDPYYMWSWLFGPRPTFQTIVSGDTGARAVTSAALRWLTVAGRCRTALYLHYGDTRPPLHPPPAYARMFIDQNAPTKIGLTFDGATEVDEDEHADRQRVKDLYDAAIAYTDRQLGRLFRGLARRRLLDRSIVVVTADYGLELWDHGKFGRGQSLYDELLHVPLIMRLPGERGAGDVSEVASTLDLVPTIAEAAGFGAQKGDGVSLVSVVGDAAVPQTEARTRPEQSPAAGDDTGRTASPSATGTSGGPGSRSQVSGPSRMIFATVSYAEPGIAPRQAVRTTTRKLIRNVDDGSVEAYDLVADPGERRNLGLAAGGSDLLAALDAIRLRIADRGDHLVVRSRSDQAVRYSVTLVPTPPAPFVDPDRLTLERNDRVRVGPLSATLTVSGTLEPGDEDHVRMDLMSASGTLDVTVTLEGAPAPEGTLRVGATARPAGTSIDLADPALFAPPPTAPPPDASTPPVTVTFWRTERRADARAGAR